MDNKMFADTVSDMLSEDEGRKMSAEIRQLQIRIGTLKKLIEDYKDGTLGFVPRTEVSLLESQLLTMEAYLSILVFRQGVEKECDEG